MASQSLGGVVDTTLKVYGTSNLRVVDASIMPLQVGAHLQATVYAISEKVGVFSSGLIDGLNDECRLLISSSQGCNSVRTDVMIGVIRHPQFLGCLRN